MFGLTSAGMDEVAGLTTCAHVIGSMNLWYGDALTGPLSNPTKRCADWCIGEVLRSFNQCIDHPVASESCGRIEDTLYGAHRKGSWQHCPYKVYKKKMYPSGLAPNYNDCI